MNTDFESWGGDVTTTGNPEEMPRKRSLVGLVPFNLFPEPLSVTVGYVFSNLTNVTIFIFDRDRTSCSSRVQSKDLLLITGCQFEIEFSFCAHPVGVGASVVPGHVDPAVVQFAGNST